MLMNILIGFVNGVISWGTKLTRFILCYPATAAQAPIVVRQGFEALPPEVLLSIADQLETGDVVSLSMTSSYLRQVYSQTLFQKLTITTVRMKVPPTTILPFVR
jgi:hypothetical protein